MVCEHKYMNMDPLNYQVHKLPMPLHYWRVVLIQSVFCKDISAEYWLCKWKHNGNIIYCAIQSFTKALLLRDRFCQNSSLKNILGETLSTKNLCSIVGFHSVLSHRKTLGGQIYTYCVYVICGSERISLNCIYMLPNTRSIPMINT